MYQAAFETSVSSPRFDTTSKSEALQMRRVEEHSVRECSAYGLGGGGGGGVCDGVVTGSVLSSLMPTRKRL